MSKTDFQNGFALGMASKGKVLPAKNVEAVGMFANDIIVPTVTIASELKDNSIEVVGLSVTDKE